MSEAQRVSHESISSVKLSRNAKGGTQIETKVYNEDPNQATTKVQEIYDALCEKYAFSD